MIGSGTGLIMKLAVAVGTELDEFNQGMDHVQQQVQGLAGNITSAGVGLTKGITAPLLGVVGTALAAGSSVDNAFSIIRQGTGATGKELEGLHDNFMAVFRAVPQAAPEVAATLSNLSTYTGAYGDELENLTKLTLDFARVNNEEAVASSENLGRLMNALEVDIKELPFLLDKLTFASQDTGIGVNNLVNYIIEAGPAFEEMGFDIDRSIALFSQFHKAGARPEETLSTLNMLLTKMAKEGLTDAEEAFNVLLAEIAAAPSILEATAIASEYFGSRVGAKVAEDIQSGKFEVDDFVKTLQGAGGTLEDTARDSMTFTESIAMLKNEMTVALQPLGAVMIDLFHEFKPVISVAIDLLRGFTEAFGALDPNVKKIIAGIVGFLIVLGPVLMIVGGVIGKLTMVIGTLGKFGGLIVKIGKGILFLGKIIKGLIIFFKAKGVALLALSGPIGWIIGAIIALIAVGIALWKNWDKVKEHAVKIWGAISDFFSNLWEGIKGVFSTAWEWIKESFFKYHPLGWLISNWEAVKGFFANLWDNIKGAFSTAWEWIKDSFFKYSPIGWLIANWDGVKDFFSNLWENVKGIFSNALQGIRDYLTNRFEVMREFISNIWTRISTFFDSIWDKIITTVETAISNLRANLITRFEAIRDFLFNIWERVRDFLARIWDIIRNTITTKAQEVYRNVRSKLEELWSYIASIPQRAYEWGRQILQRFWDGLKSIFTGVYSWVSSKVGGLFDRLNPLKRRSPSLVDEIARGVKEINKLYRSIEVPDFELRLDKDFSGLPSLDRNLNVNVPALDLRKSEVTVDHTGTITVKGIDSKEELIGVFEAMMDRLATDIRRGDRRVHHSTGIIPW